MADEVRDHRHALDLLRQAAVPLPAVVPGIGKGGYFVFSAMKVLGHGATIHEAMVAAGFWPPVKAGVPFFIRDGLTVAYAGDRGRVVATAFSSTMARRIANALNEYIPGDRGF